MEERIPHGEVGHFCHGGCAGYAKGGRVPEQRMDAIARNREELGLPGTEGGLSTVINEIPGIGLIKNIAERSDMKDRLANPEMLHNTAGKGLETNYTHGQPYDEFGKEANVQMLSEGGMAGQDGMTSNPNPMPMERSEETAGTDPSEMPENVREYVERAHKQIRESRPDEGWRIKSADQEKSVAPYKREEEETASEDHGEEDMPHYDEGGTVKDENAYSAPGTGLMNFIRNLAVKGKSPLAKDDNEVLTAMNVDPVDPSTGTVHNYDEGGMVGDQPFDPNSDLQALAPPGTGMIAPSPAMAKPAPPVAMPPPMAAAPVAKPPMPTAPALTDQDYMDRANKTLGLNPEQQAGFMKLLGGNAQKAQIGAGIAGIGDAIASGGTLGKVNPGALNKSEELINGRTSEGLEGLKSIRENQGKASEMADKLEARDPNSPLSKYAQKAYAGVGKKIGLDLSHASAALIADVSGKGVEALNTEYQGQLKQMGIDLQKKTLDATVANQKAERDISRQGQQLQATKDLGTRTLGNKLEGIIPGTPAHTEKNALERIASGERAPTPVNSKAEYDALPAGTHYVDSYGTEKVKK